MRLLGTDVSSYQPNLEYAGLKQLDVAWVIAKVTEGLGYVDPEYPDHRAGAEGQGMPFGGYNFLRIRRGVNPITDAENFLSHRGPRTSLPSTLDVEDTGTDLNPWEAAQWVLRYAQAIEEDEGRPSILYTGGWYWGSSVAALPEFARNPLWLSLYPGGRDYRTIPWPSQVPAPWSEVSLYQFAGDVPVLGMGSGDLDVADSSTIARLTQGVTDTMTPAQEAKLDAVIDRLDRIIKGWGPTLDGIIARQDIDIALDREDLKADKDDLVTDLTQVHDADLRVKGETPPGKSA